MKKLFEIVQERNSLENALSQEYKRHKEATDSLGQKIAELKRLEGISENNIDVEIVQLAESVLYVQGNPYGRTSDVTKFGHKVIAEQAIVDIANGASFLKRKYFGNKEYSGYYQGCDCEYGYGPSHGYIVDRIGLYDVARKRDLTDEEKDACIYYLKNYNRIKTTVNQ